jgi:hypothetical protein
MKTTTALTDENAEGARSYNPMELHPEDFKQTFAETWVEWMKEEKVASIQIVFPARSH